MQSESRPQKPEQLPNLNTQLGKELLLQIAETISSGCLAFAESVLSIDEEVEVSVEQLLEALQQIFKYEVAYMPRPVCRKIFSENCYGFKCEDCSIDKNTIICIQCFNKADHKGHSYLKYKSTGFCDCGNEDLLKKSGFYSDHSQSEEVSIPIDTETT